MTSQHFPLDPIGKLLGVTVLREMQLGYSNLSKEEWEAVGTLIDDYNTVIKKLIKVSMLLFGVELAILQRQEVS